MHWKENKLKIVYYFKINLHSRSISGEPKQESAPYDAEVLLVLLEKQALLIVHILV